MIIIEASELAAALANAHSALDEIGRTEADLRRAKAEVVRDLQCVRAEIVRRALLISCPHPRCGVDAGEQCLNLRSGGPKIWPHTERIDSYGLDVGLPVGSLNPWPEPPERRRDPGGCP